jgi:hypothetical protein
MQRQVRNMAAGRSGSDPQNPAKKRARDSFDEIGAVEACPPPTKRSQPWECPSPLLQCRPLSWEGMQDFTPGLIDSLAGVDTVMTDITDVANHSFPIQDRTQGNPATLDYQTPMLTLEPCSVDCASETAPAIFVDQQWEAGPTSTVAAQSAPAEQFDVCFGVVCISSESRDLIVDEKLMFGHRLKLKALRWQRDRPPRN